MRSECATFRKLAITAGLFVTLTAYAGCAFFSVNSGLVGTDAEAVEATAPAAISIEYLAHEENAPETETNATDGGSKETSESSEPSVASETTEETTASETDAADTEPLSVKVTFVGDCTLCSDARHGSHFNSVVKKNWEYPFKNCRTIFSNDDLTLANCEMAVTSRTKYVKKKFVFAMKPEGTKYFTKNSIEAVNLANNHTLDFGQAGLKDTRNNLTKAGVLWSDGSHSTIFTAKNGVKIGMCGYSSGGSIKTTYKLIKTLKSKGCQIVIVSCHWGIEGDYKQSKNQTKYGHALIDHGADIVVGTHPHRLQPIEVYKGKYILYSLGNFCFGGNTNPSDPDSVIIQCTFVLDETGKKAVDYRLNVIPFSLRSTKRGNDYCPKPYNFESKEYDRVMARLNWAQGDE